MCSSDLCWSEMDHRDFPGPPVVRTPHFHCRGLGLGVSRWVWVPVLLSHVRALGHTYAHAQMGRAGWTTPIQNRCGDSAPDNKGVHQGDTSGLRAPWAPWEWGDHQGAVSQCMDQRGRSVGNTGPGRPAGRSRRCSRVFGSISPSTTGQTLYRQTRNWRGGVGARISLRCLGDPRSSQVETRMPLKQM